MKAIKENWKLVLIVAAGIIAVIFMCIFGVQGAQNKAFAMEEQVNTADNSSFYENSTIEETVDYLESDWELWLFWVIWIIVIGLCVFGFYYIDNEWIEN